MKFPYSLAALSFLSLLFFAAPSHSADTSLYGELVKKAKAEQEVEYWSPMNEEPANRILKVFSEKFGINAKFMRWVDTGVQQRNLIEIQSGRALRADLVAPNREAQQQFLDAGAFQKPSYEYLKVWPEIDKRQYDPSGWALNLSGNSRAIVYNTNLVSAKQIPKTWDDCARPEFKSKVVLDVRHKLYALHYHRREWFLDWVKRMVANDVKLIRGQTEVMQPMAAGAYALFCSAQPYTAQTMIDKGIKNLKIAVPGELLMESAEAAFVRKGSPHAHAAQLLAGWFASTEAQRLLDKED
jgi:ABC-type Fe3+ transport system substrate-binding protein